MKKIAIIKFHDDSGNYTDEYYSNKEYVINSITEWQEVSQKDFDLLIQNRYQYGYAIVELNPEITRNKKVLSTIDDYLNDIKEEEAKRQKHLEQIRQKQETQKAARKEKSIEQKRKQLEKLKKELGEE